MRSDLVKLKSETNIVDIIGRYIPLEKKGGEYKGMCPWHEDSKPSLNVNEKKQLFFCPVCETKKGDVFDFLKFWGIPLPEAIEVVAGDRDFELPPDVVKQHKVLRKKPMEWKHLRPVAECADFKHYEKGEPKYKYAYRDEKGLVGYVCRFEYPDGGKDTMPLIYASNEQRTGWVYHGFTERPLYNTDLLALYPTLPVVLCEGEKVADWLTLRSGNKFVAVTWVGGSNQVQKSDFSRLAGRRVLICNDNDEPGKKCMEAAIGKFAGEVVRWAEIPKGVKKGWDMADSGFDSAQVQNYVRRNLRAPIIKKHNQDETHFTYLGYEKSDNQPVFIFYGRMSKTVFRLTTSSMTKATLMCMAPLDWWKDKYNGFNTDGVLSAANTLINTSYKVGIYSPKNVRGRGAWFDDGRVVIHAGDKLIVDGEVIALGELDTNYIYEIGESFNFNTHNPLPADQAKRLLEITRLLNWERKVNAELLAGWCVIATVCGALKWRPHIWITGGASVGKSFVFTYIVRMLLGEACLDVQGVTTEAGIRQALGYDALSVVFDEIDGNTPKAQARIEETLELARSASADDTGRIIKGSASHSAKAFMIRSCFAFSSILIAADKGSDKRRITTLALVGMPKEHEVLRKERYEKLKKLRSETINDQFVAGLHARTIHLLPVILENSGIFTAAVTDVLGMQAMGDQLGPMLAGAYSLQYDGLITYDKAIEYVKAQDWADERETERERDEVELLKNLMLWVVKVDGYGERAIGELVEHISAPNPADTFLKKEVAVEVLRRSGFKVDQDSETLLIANNHAQINGRLERTKWSRNYHKILVRLPDAKEDNQRISPGKPSRCVRLPMAVVNG